ncbi:hypothetical protein GBA52_029005 [Prunus armeniaca]|nr:hypothetical protein GBA52_029005 [Prunus armeniaca]
MKKREQAQVEQREWEQQWKVFHVPRRKMMKMGEMWAQLGSVMASMMFAYAMFKQFFPDDLGNILDKYTKKLVGYVYPYIQISFDEYTNEFHKRSEVYASIQSYLSTKSSTRAKRLKAHDVKGSTALVLGMDDNEEVTDEFQGIKLWWASMKSASKKTSFSFYPEYDERKHYKLTFHRRHRDLVMGTMASPSVCHFIWHHLIASLWDWEHPGPASQQSQTRKKPCNESASFNARLAFHDFSCQTLCFNVARTNLTFKGLFPKEKNDDEDGRNGASTGLSDCQCDVCVHYFSTIPSPQLRYYVEKYSHKLVKLFYPYIQITFDEYTNEFRKRSEVYSAIQSYLSTKSSTIVRRLKAQDVKDSKSLVLAMDDNEEVADEFQGIKVWWVLVKRELRQTSFSVYPQSDEKKHYKLTFHRRHRDVVTGAYLAHVIKEGRQ